VTTPDYFQLSDEGTWIEYLRTRLPYSFSRIEKDNGKNSRKFVVSEPILLSDQEPAESHNFWRRGNVSYMTGKLLDYFSLSDIGTSLRFLEVLQLVTQEAEDLRRPWPNDLYAFYNSMQMEKVWRFAQENHLDRERAMMSNVIQGVELCLKAISTHASYREAKCFKFSAGHEVVDLYEKLPQPLRDEIAAESKTFAKEYLEFRKQVYRDIVEVLDNRRKWPISSNSVSQIKTDWDRLAKRIMESSYTAFVNSNDPGASEEELHENWLEEALNRIRSVDSKGGISVYFRYAPIEDRDKLPVDLLHGVLLLGRFMYEHLFPVPLSDTRPVLIFPS
jgi:hypothetical protein